MYTLVYYVTCVTVSECVYTCTVEEQKGVRSSVAGVSGDSETTPNIGAGK